MAPVPNADSPIGLFDSGVGGVTVLRALVERLPHENFIYLGDTARLPYGAKSPDTIRRYFRQCLSFLARRQGVKAAIVACNSASTAMLASPDEAKAFDIPVYNVIEPGAHAAVKAAPSARIGVLGTRATIMSGAYPRAIRALAPSAAVFSQACPLLVPLVEEGWEEDPLTNLIVYRYVSALLPERPEALILGCTHYPALRAALTKAVGPNVTLVDSALAIADILQADVASGRLPGRSPQAIGSVRLLATDVSDVFAQTAARLLGLAAPPALELVDLD